MFIRRLLFMVIIFSACEQPSDSSRVPVNDEKWKTINMYIDGQMIEIQHDERIPCFNRLSRPTDTVLEFQMPRQEREIIFEKVNALIKDSVQPKSYVTPDSSIEVMFSVSNDRQINRNVTTNETWSIRFAYISSWSEISEQTRMIYMLLSHRTALNRK